MNSNPEPTTNTSGIDLSNIKVISFDCYGTLIDWESGIYNALSPVLQNHNITLNRDDLLEIYSELEPQAQSAQYRPYCQILPDVVNGFAKRFGFQPTKSESKALANSIGDWPPFPDSTDALRKLQSIRKLAIISNIDNDLIKLSTERLQVDFDWIITAENAKAYKPALSVFHHAFKQMNLEPKQILHVAQSIFHDIVPANKLNIQNVWVNRRKGLSGTGATPPATASPTLEVSSLAQLAEILFD